MDSADLLVCIGERASSLQLAASLLLPPSPPRSTSLPTCTSPPILVLPDSALVADQDAKDLVMAALRKELPLVRRDMLEVVVEQRLTAMALDEVVVSRGGMSRPLQVFWANFLYINMMMTTMMMLCY